MYALLVLVLVVVSVCLIGVVLIQSGKGDGLSGAFGMGEGQAVFGNRAGDVLTKATSWFAIAFMALCLAVTWQSKRAGDSMLTGMGGGPRQTGGSRAPLMTMAELERREAAAKTGEVAASASEGANTGETSIVEGETNAVTQ